MIKELVHVTFWVPRSLVDEFLEFVRCQGLCQFIPSDGASMVMTQTGSLFETLTGLCEALKLHGSVDERRVALVLQLSETERAKLTRTLEKLEQEVGHIEKERAQLELQRSSLHDLKKFPGPPKISAGEGQSSSLWWLPPGVDRRLLDEIQKKLDPNEPVQWQIRESRNGRLMVEICCATTQKRVVDVNMEKAGCLQWTSTNSGEDQDYAQTFAQLAQKDRWLEEQQQVLDQKLEQLKVKWAKILPSMREALRRERAVEKVHNGGENVGMTLRLCGWIPRSSFEEFGDQLEQHFAGRIGWECRPPNEDEHPPTLLSQRTQAKPYSLLMKLVRLPLYGTADPTGLIALFFPFFAGCIVGDWGYSLLMLGLTLLPFANKSDLWKSVGKMMRAVSFWGIFWGLLYGECFGDLGYRLFGLHAFWVDRHHEPLPVLGIALVFGLVHVLIGLACGAWFGFKNGHRRHGIEKTGNMLVIVGLVVALASAAKFLPSWLSWGGGLTLALGMVMMGFGGVGGLIESLGSLGSVLSYVRIGAIGLSSAILALTAGKFLDTFGLNPVGIFSFVALHSLNFCLAFAESSLHSARLHFVEFMGKFYDDRGQPFRPLK